MSDDAPRPALDAGTLEWLRARYAPKRVDCGHGTWESSGDPGVLALLAAYDAAAERADRYERALTAIQGWDCLNPPATWLCGDFPWLKRLVDRVLRGGEALREDDDNDN